MFGENNFSTTEDCMIYVDSHDIRFALSHAIASLDCDESDNGAVIVRGGIEIRAAHNDYGTPDDSGPDEFLQWWTVLEIIPLHNALEGKVREVSERILLSLWGVPLRAVAACDFKLELPHRGGIDLY
ncbi:hypothetical protein OHB39_39305 [Streptomyces sp. NBC_00047]|uniref:hypothetical protein n=1 Tax=Streptomyces sp. NBC_00047 TaxID=2975627 RepID=UPI00224F926F|nr:hypothetical protein [Streptomyces sp. NBC_00047]MCX5613495.1 hypothetical protein [Streptomyces sp. NBC_00047]